MPGGRIAPDGRPPQVPGVGKNAKRHDLEAPATPGLHGSDLQQGDVQMLENGQRVSPRPKKQQPAAGPQPKPQRTATGATGPSQMQIPDPIQFASKRLGGGNPTTGESGGRMVDPSPWIPLLQQMAMRPNSGGSIVANLANALNAYRRRPIVTQAYLVDMNSMDARIAEEY